MGAEGPRCKQPARYIRHIYNRIILENATVRAAAVSSLAVFGASVESLTPRVVTLLKRALYDNDDEVGDCVPATGVTSTHCPMIYCSVHLF
jgi:coatomer protein complex subunit gamma